MNGSQKEQKKTALIKVLAIVGLLVALILTAWLAVFVVRSLPTAVDTLASLFAAREDRTEETLTVSTSEELVTSDEPVTISWTDAGTAGVYTFSYKCTDHISAQLVVTDEVRTPIACDSALTLPTSENSATFVFTSEAQRFIDIDYTVQFTPENSAYARTGSGSLTVVNPAVAEREVVTEVPPEEDEVDDIPAEETPTHGGTITIPTLVTAIPISDPNGYTDLSATFVAVGAYNTRTDRFSPRNELERDERSAVQFIVHNLGTKTSGVWYFTASLPTDSSFTFVSGAQTPLKPQERQLITLQFDTSDERGSETLSVYVTGGNDYTPANNQFTRHIRID